MILSPHRFSLQANAATQDRVRSNIRQRARKRRGLCADSSIHVPCKTCCCVRRQQTRAAWPAADGSSHSHRGCSSAVVRRPLVSSCGFNCMPCCTLMHTSLAQVYLGPTSRAQSAAAHLHVFCAQVPLQALPRLVSKHNITTIDLCRARRKRVLVSQVCTCNCWVPGQSVKTCLRTAVPQHAEPRG